MSESIKHTTLVVAGLCCATEEATISRKLNSLKGIEELKFNLVTKRLEVRHSCDESEILAGLRAVGLPGSVERGRRTPPETRTIRTLLMSTIVSSALFGTGLLCSAFDLPPLVSTPVFLAAILLAGWNVGIRAVKAVANLSLDMNFLMAIAVLGAIGIGEYAEGAAVIVLFSVSLLLESLSTDRSRRAIESLLKLSPTTATIHISGKETVVPVEEVPVGEIITIRPGERIPLDGTVISGSSSVDQSAITGESIPVLKSESDTVFAGSFNQRGALEVRTTKTAGDSTIARIVSLVEEAQSGKAPSQTFIERFARIYTPAVFVLAVGIATIPPVVFGGLFGEWFYRALVLLVIACPCALVISTPVSVINALTNAARRGVLIKGGRHLERVAGVRVVALDKTGTLTLGSADVTDIVSLDSVAPAEILRIAAALEVKSEHHLAEALIRKAHSEGIDSHRLTVQNFQSIPGKGVRATIEGREYALGNHPLVEELGRCSPKLETVLGSLEAQGKTAIVLSDGGGAVGVIGIADSVRAESRNAVEAIRRLGVHGIALLTGDNRGTAEFVGRELGVDEVRAELLPEQKLESIRDLRKKFGTVAMVGDGVNDAPALAEADVGIAMGGVGSDTSLETADIVLMSDNLLQIPATIRLGKKALAIIKQNIVIALL
ncbi:MAG TPA: heavy metal translocating P-type ATPase, partial [Bacteroidota bacterium]